MEPFKVTIIPIEVFNQYISSYDFITYVDKLKKYEIEGFLRQFVTEGIPFHFKDSPLIYEEVRTYLSKRIGIHPKEILLVGSGSVGFSMSPMPDFGKAFNIKESDLDFTIISNCLFEGLVKEYKIWKKEVDDGVKKPRNNVEKTFWNQNLLELPQKIKRGFIDTHYIPNFYPTSQKVNQSLWQIREKLNLSLEKDNAFKKKFSARVYSNWKSFATQFMINYHRAVNTITTAQKELLKMR